ncbi:MAG: histidine phosphatase family protein [Leptospiraceae bacterium]|nr:histidine phosphatase family protein [Leptospiraceae bacterium]
MQTIYFIRHGQANFAGGPEGYDKLSPIGKEQAVLIKDYFAKENIKPDFIYTGNLRRHHETCKPLVDNFNYPEDKIIKTEQLDEFTPTLWKSLAMSLAAKDEKLAHELDIYQRKVQSNQKRAMIYFFKLTAILLTKWKEGLTPEGEISYIEFINRINDFIQMISNSHNSGHIFIFSSGTPISIFISKLLNMPIENEMDWMYSLVNTSISCFKGKNGDFKPVYINATPHIIDNNKRSMV